MPGPGVARPMQWHSSADRCALVLSARLPAYITSHRNIGFVGAKKATRAGVGGEGGGGQLARVWSRTSSDRSQRTVETAAFSAADGSRRCDNIPTAMQ